MKLEVGSTVIGRDINRYAFHTVEALPKKNMYTDDYVHCDHRIPGHKTGTPEQIAAFMDVYLRMQRAQKECADAYNALEDAE